MSKMANISLLSTLSVCAVGCMDYDIHNLKDPNPPNLEVSEIHAEEVVFEECPTDEPDLYSPDNTPGCAEEPAIGEFNPTLEWSWTAETSGDSYKRIESPPVVINLNDDNGDGVIDSLDIPDIVFPSFKGQKYRADGPITAISGATHEPLFVTYIEEFPFWGLSGIAVGDVDDDGVPEIFAATKKGVMRLSNEGEFVWHTEIQTQKAGSSIISLANIDGVGDAEIIIGGAAIDSNGNLLWKASGNSTENYLASFAADLDQDGMQEIITAGTVFEHDGSIRWTLEGVTGFPAIGDIDGDLLPDIVSSSGGRVTVVNREGELLWEAEVPQEGNATKRSGPPTIADFDGDGLAEIGVASTDYYVVYDDDGSILWQQPIMERSSGRTGSSVFDFEGDGVAEVVYADEETLWVFDGASGEVELAWDEHSSGTRFEYPTIVDIDADGSAEIILPGGRGATLGISIIGSEDSSWAPARSIWNQYAYSINNVNEDGSIPKIQAPNWLNANSFRAGNSETKIGLDLPDLQLGEPQSCIDECEEGYASVFFPIENAGQNHVADEIVVQVQTQNGIVDVVSIPHLQSDSVYWIGPYDLNETDFSEGVVVSIDGADLVYECVENNNSRTFYDFPCEQ